MAFDPSSLNNFLLIAAAWGGGFHCLFLAQFAGLDLSGYPIPGQRSPGENPGSPGCSCVVSTRDCGLFDLAPAANDGRGISAYARGRSLAAGY